MDFMVPLGKGGGGECRGVNEPGTVPDFCGIGYRAYEKLKGRLEGFGSMAGRSRIRHIIRDDTIKMITTFTIP